MNLLQRKVARELFRVQVSLRTLDEALRRLTPVLTVTTKASTNGAAKPARPVSAKARASMVLQGRYMGYMVRPECDAASIGSRSAVPV